MLKKELRTKYKNLRTQLSSEDRKEMSSKILSQLSDNFDFKDKIISVFLPIEKFAEVLTWPFVEEADFIKVLPVIDGQGTLKHIKYMGSDQIKVNTWGIPEPQFGEAYSEQEIDFVIVPLLITNSSGYRVGYGKGFYDRFLSSCRPDCVFIGLGYFDEFEEIDNLNEWDIPLHHLVSPNKLYSF